MQYLAVVALFPLLVWVLSLGTGLLIERLSGARLHALLLLPLGFGGLIVVSQFTTWFAGTAPFTPIVLVLLALLGFVLARRSLAHRWRDRRSGWWLSIAPAVGAYALAAAPEIAAGRATFSGYLLDTTGAIQLAGAEHLLQHGHTIVEGLPAYGTTLFAYFGQGYPSGGHGVLASVGWLSGQDLIWLYSVFQALELGMLALVLAYLARRAGLGRGPAAVTGIVASLPALVYAYVLMGSIKEITALPMLGLMGALLVCARELRIAGGWRAVLPFAVAAAAALDSIGLAGSPWVALFAAGGLLIAVPLRRRSDLRALAAAAVVLAASVALVALPTVGPISKSLNLAKSVSNSNSAAVSDPGNLLRPLKFIQVFGVWLGESHRVEPREINQTYLLLGVIAVCLVLGVLWLLRRRAWAVAGVVVISLVVWLFLHGHATPWTDAKLLVILSPIVVFVAMLGAFGVMQQRRVEGLLLVLGVSFGILYSDALLYHATNLAPTQRYSELASIGARYSGAGPTLAPDFDEYSLYLLRKMKVDSPGLAYPGAFSYVPPATHGYGHSYDLDTLALPAVERFRTIILRRSPGWSRPPSNFVLAWSGAYYTVWRRVGPSPLAHIPIGTGWQPAAPSCKLIRSVALRAQRAHASLAYSARPRNVVVEMSTTTHTPMIVGITDLEGRVLLSFQGPGRVLGSFRVNSPGDYRLWLGGFVDRPMQVIVDGRRVGAPSAQSGDDATVIDVGRLALGPGVHSLQLLRGGGDLRPDDSGSTAIDGVVLEPLGAQPGVQRLAPQAWRSLCGRSLDWVEIV